LSSVYQYVIYLVLSFVVRWSPRALWISLCWYQVPFTANSLRHATFTVHFPLSFVLLWRLCPPHAG
jgi:hypothetical protein